ncbi:MAG: hypothetical protein L0Z62_19350, partial [Gemmataceae bacterium]|nr:hypothetical protein [Gemmataceae bacterium]
SIDQPHPVGNIRGTLPNIFGPFQVFLPFARGFRSKTFFQEIRLTGDTDPGAKEAKRGTNKGLLMRHRDCTQLAAKRCQKVGNTAANHSSPSL